MNFLVDAQLPPALARWIAGQGHGAVHVFDLALHSTTGTAYAVALSGNYAYVADGAAGLSVIDVSAPENPQRLGGYSAPGTARSVAVSGNYAYLAADAAGLLVLDVSEPANPRLVGSCSTPGPAYGLAISRGYAYVADSTAGLQVIDVSNPAHPQRVGGNACTASAYGVTVNGEYVFLAAGQDGLIILSLYTPLTGPPIWLSPAPHLDTSGFTLSVQGLPGLPMAIERSTNLLSWEPWTNGVLTTGWLDFLDQQAGAGAKQFYRAVAR